MDLEALCKIGYGVYVVCSKKGEEINGLIVNSIMQVSATPPTIAISVNKNNYTHGFIEESKLFSISVLDVDTEMDMIAHFGFESGREFNKFDDVKYSLGDSGVPVLTGDNVVANLELKVVDRIDVHTHTIFIGELVNSNNLTEKEPMTYRYYHEVKKGTSPKSAPTYQENDMHNKGEGKYICNICKYIYNPVIGDPTTDIAPGTSFEDLPDDWVCPVCKKGKEKFSQL